MFRSKTLPELKSAVASNPLSEYLSRAVTTCRNLYSRKHSFSFFLTSLWGLQKQIEKAGNNDIELYKIALDILINNSNYALKFCVASFFLTHHKSWNYINQCTNYDKLFEMGASRYGQHLIRRAARFIDVDLLPPHKDEKGKVSYLTI